MVLIRRSSDDDSDGQKLKREGMEKALAALRVQQWKVEFYQEVIEQVSLGGPFTSEDIIAEVGLPSGTVGTHTNNAVGAMMSSLAKLGLIKKTGRHVASQRPMSHGAELTEWIGV